MVGRGVGVLPPLVRIETASGGHLPARTELQPALQLLQRSRQLSRRQAPYQIGG